MLKVLSHIITITFFVNYCFAITSTDKQAEAEIEILDPLYFATYDRYFQEMSVFFKYDGAKFDIDNSEYAYTSKESFLFSYAVTTGLPNLDLVLDRFWAGNYNKYRAKWISYTLYKDIGVEEGDLKTAQYHNIFYSSNESLYIGVFALLGSLFFLRKRKKLKRKSRK